MLSSCFLISSDENLLGSINKKYLIFITLFLKHFENIRKFIEHFFTDTNIRNRRNFLRIIRLVYKLGNGGNYGRRKIVGTKITEILQSVNNGRFTRARHSCNY